MSSFLYTTAIRSILTGGIDLDTDTFRVLLTTSAFATDATTRSTHSTRGNITNEVTGTGYTATGNAVTVSVAAVDTVNHKVVVTLGSTTWPSSTITARKAIYYKATGAAGAANATATSDLLLAVNDFGADVVSTNGTLTLNASTVDVASNII